MTNTYMISLAATDAKAAIMSRSEHEAWFLTVETALDQVIQGLNEFGELRGMPRNDLESGRLFLAVRAFRTLRIAMNVLERAYYQQAAGLVRMSMEDMLIAEDIERHPPTLQVLLHGDATKKTGLGRGKLSYGAMAGRISSKAAEAWKAEYDSVSVYATHPRKEALTTIVTWDNKGVPHLTLNSQYDIEQLAVILELIAKQGMDLMKTVMQLLPEEESDWGKKAYPSFKALDALIDETRQVRV